MTAILSCVCGKYDESQDLENDFKEQHEPLKRKVIFYGFLMQNNISFHLNLFVFLNRIQNPQIIFQHLRMIIYGIN